MAADTSFDVPPGYRQPDVEEGDRPRAIVRIGKIFLVLLTLVGFVGVVWFAYSEGLKAGSEAVAPLLRAEAGPAKVVPEDPGGIEVPHRDVEVYERLEGDATAADHDGAIETVELPPPDDPQNQTDQAAAEEAAPASDETAPAASESAAETPAEATAAETAEDATAETAEDATASDAPADDATPEVAEANVPKTEEMENEKENVAEVEPEAGETVTATAPEESAPAPESKEATAETAPQTATAAPAEETAPPAPAPETESNAAAADQAQPAPDTDVAALPVHPKGSAESKAAGPFRVQLAAYRSPEEAARRWQVLRQQHADLLGNLKLHIEKVDLGAEKGIYYRLQAGPLDSRGAADALCRQLKGRKLGCLFVNA